VFTVVGLLVIAVAATSVFLLLHREKPLPRARQYLDFTACLLTDEHGVSGAAAAPVWTGMQNSSTKTLAKVQYLPVLGPQTGENAATYVASLAQSQCDIIFAVGSAEVDGVNRSAATFPATPFVVVGGKAADGTGNVSGLQDSPAAQVAMLVETRMTRAVHDSPRGR
jgi:basic membrane lipoprotein Med (substrate-binding protein (PBP1-ABC) superfamily)